MCRHVHRQPTTSNWKRTLCINMCVDVCSDMCVDRCADMCLEKFVDMCVDLRTPFELDVLCDSIMYRHACRHVLSSYGLSSYGLAVMA